MAGGTTIPPDSAQSLCLSWPGRSSCPELGSLPTGDPSEAVGGAAAEAGMGMAQSWAGTSGCSEQLFASHPTSPGASSSAWGHEMIYSPSVCKELHYKGRMELGAFLEYSNHSLLHHTWLLCVVSHNSFQLSDSSTRSESRHDYPEKNLITVAPLLTFC